MIEVLRAGVRTFECDQMGHMNVRHYFARMREAVDAACVQLGWSPARLAQDGLRLQVSDQHLRFLGELRPGTPFCMWAGVLDASPERLRLYVEMRFVDGPRLAAASTLDVTARADDGSGTTRLPAALLTRAQQLQTARPAHGQVRGVSDGPARQPPRLGEAVELGMTGAFLGPLRAEHCDDAGVVSEAGYMGLIADGIGHLFRRIRPGGIRPEGIGGAAMEYRFAFHGRPRQGQFVEVRSGLMGLERKTFRMCHWVFDLDDERCVASAEAVALSFDLTTRKAIEIEPALRAHMQQHVIGAIGL